ncbi:MAG: hypothetical protein ACTH16_07105, partial [Corynebacterium variabile]|uniref:hypothetical protein n=1 Tax=Corynebacterium variabile TaxID=1727 RepID=UPI003F91F0FC
MVVLPSDPVPATGIVEVRLAGTLARTRWFAGRIPRGSPRPGQLFFAAAFFVVFLAVVFLAVVFLAVVF